MNTILDRCYNHSVTKPRLRTLSFEELAPELKEYKLDIKVYNGDGSGCASDIHAEEIYSCVNNYELLPGSYLGPNELALKRNEQRKWYTEGILYNGIKMKTYVTVPDASIAYSNFKQERIADIIYSSTNSSNFTLSSRATRLSTKHVERCGYSEYGLLTVNSSGSNKIGFSMYWRGSYWQDWDQGNVLANPRVMATFSTSVLHDPTSGNGGPNAPYDIGVS